MLSDLIRERIVDRLFPVTDESPASAKSCTVKDFVEASFRASSSDSATCSRRAAVASAIACSKAAMLVRSERSLFPLTKPVIASAKVAGGETLIPINASCSTVRELAGERLPGPEIPASLEISWTMEASALSSPVVSAPDGDRPSKTALNSAISADDDTEPFSPIIAKS